MNVLLTGMSHRILRFGNKRIIGKHRKQRMVINSFRWFYFFLLLPMSLGAQEVRLVTVDELHQLLSNPKKPVLVNFWATWCRPCIEEIPYLLEAHRRHPEAFDLLFVSVDFRSQQQAVRNTVKRLNMQGTLLHLIAEGDWINQIDPNWSGAIPFTLLRHNQKVAYFYDAFDSVNDVLNFVRSNL
ncbi:MAG: thioredoxin domain-containing protein [Chitinophagales bacterium]|nr:thioredoxin domain-containing protein [Chitinophagales bacterium]MDW8428392.1 TlpA family protein disulfide reductase [Chitinophagales bacterium]